jgi:hypothetical protein
VGNTKITTAYLQVLNMLSNDAVVNVRELATAMLQQLKLKYDMNVM